MMFVAIVLLIDLILGLLGTFISEALNSILSTVLLICNIIGLIVSFVLGSTTVGILMIVCFIVGWLTLFEIDQPDNNGVTVILLIVGNYVLKITTIVLAFLA